MTASLAFFEKKGSSPIYLTNKCLEAIVRKKNTKIKGVIDDERRSTPGCWAKEKHAIDALEKEGKKVVTCAPTWIAARNIGGATLHHTLGIPIGIIEPKKDVLISKRVQELLEVTDVIVIDEISMVRVDVFDWIIKIIEAEAKPHYSVSSKKKISNRI
mgnify:CR=1 FL=1